MLKIFSCLLLMSAPAMAADNNPFGQVPRDCDITLKFGTYTTGIDSKLYADAIQYISTTPAIVEKHLLDLDQRGERTLCLRVTPQDEPEVYSRLVDMIPESSTVGWEEVVRKNGDRFRNAWPQKFTPKPSFN